MIVIDLEKGLDEDKYEKYIKKVWEGLDKIKLQRT
jgi:hypothetical protein